jgi:hypothetical protein
MASSSGQATAAGGGAVYGLGLIGALVWNFQEAGSFLGYIGGFLESLVWPAFFVYELFKLAAS